MSRTNLSTPAAPPRPTGFDQVVLAALLLAAVALRAFDAFRTPVWFEEIYILEVVRRPLAAVLQMVRDDIHAPLFYTLRWAWTALAGPGETGHRVLSMIFAFGALYAAFRLTRLMFGWRAGLLALALVAVNGMHAYYSGFVEDYALNWCLLLMTAGSAYAFVTWKRTPDLATFALWAVLALYNHYLAISVVALLGVWGLWRLRWSAPWRAWLLALAFIAVAWLPQAMIFLEQFRREGSGSFFTWPTHADFHRLWQISSLGVHVLMPVFLLLALLPLVRARTRSAAVLLWLLILVPIFEKRMWVVILPREGLLVVSLVAALVAGGVALLPGRWIRTGLALVLVLLGIRAWTKRSQNPQPLALQKAERIVTGAAPAIVVHAETNSLLYFRYHQPRLQNRLLMTAGQRAPYFDAGLVIPDSCYMTPAEFDSLTRAGAPWWGVEVDRAFVTRGVVYRAGTDAIAALEAAPRDTAWDMPPVRLVRGRRGGER